MRKQSKSATDRHGRDTRKPMVDPSAWAAFKQRVKEQSEALSWDQQSEATWELIERHLPKPLDAKVEPDSDGWIALQLRACLGAADSAVERGEVRAAASEALQVGLLLGRWPAARKLRKQLEQTASAGTKGGSKTPRKAKRLSKEVEYHAAIYRKDPKCAEHSTREMARWIADQLGRPLETIRGHLRRRGIK